MAGCRSFWSGQGIAGRTGESHSRAWHYNVECLCLNSPNACRRCCTLLDCFCCSPGCAYDLFVSQDFAASWTNLTANSAGRVSSFRDFDWGCKMEM